MATVCASHEIGAPCTTLVKVLACDPYSSHTVEFFGVNASAEWYICGEDALMISKYLVTKGKQSFARSSVGDSCIQSE